MRCTWCLNTVAKVKNCKITGSVLYGCEMQSSLFTRMAVYCVLSYLYPHKILCTVLSVPSQNIMHSLICTLTKYYLGDQIKKNELSGTCSMYGRHKRCIKGFWWGNLRENDHLEDLDIKWRIILK